MAVSACIPQEIHWVITGELTFPGKWFAPMGRPLSRFVLRHIAQVYGFSTMPPMPPRAADARTRAAAVHCILRFAQTHPDAVIGLAPEGGDQPGGILNLLPPGLGRFCGLLRAAGFHFLPVGVYECDGALTLNFGERYRLEDAGTSGRENDRLTAMTVMSHIAALLPPQLRGSIG